MSAESIYRWGIWFTNGEMSFGWLAYEGRHGRPYTIKVDSKEKAEEIARENQENEDKYAHDGYVYGALSLDAKDEEFDEAVTALRDKARARQRARWA